MQHITRAPRGADASTVLRIHTASTDEECVIWTGALTEKGYGRLEFRGRMYRAHRFAYETYIGPIPEGQELDHRCGVTACVNIRHLQALTQQEHIALERERRARRKRVAAAQARWLEIRDGRAA